MKTRGEEISDNLKNRRKLRAGERNRRNKKRGAKKKIKIFHRKKKQKHQPSIRADAEAKVNTVNIIMIYFPARST